MKTISKTAVVLFLAIFLNGCLLFHKISYEVVLDEPNKGTATVIFYDIRSDARSNSEFDEDRNNIFNFILKSDDFVNELSKEGKSIQNRELIVSGDTLNGKAVFSFDNINAVERIVYEDGFFYMTLPLEDSVITTNGEIIQSKDYKRILWDGNSRYLRFEIFSTDFAEGNTRKLAQYYKK